MRVVVALPPGDVVGQRRRHRAVDAVPAHQIRHVVAHHPAEPAELIPLMGQVGADIGGRGHADGDGIGGASRRPGRVAHRADGPPGDVGVGRLQDEPVGLLAGQRKRLRPVGRHPDLQLAVAYPRDLHHGPVQRRFPALGQVLDHPHRLGQRGQRSRLLADDPPGGIAAADAADRPVAEHVVERGEQRGGDRPVAGTRVGHHRADDQCRRRREYLRVDDERLLPQDMRVESPAAAEAQVLGLAHRADDTAGRRISLQNQAEFHRLSPRSLRSGPTGRSAPRLAHQLCYCCISSATAASALLLLHQLRYWHSSRCRKRPWPVTP